MRRRTFLGLSAAALAAGALGGWTLSNGSAQPLLLSARNDDQGVHYAVGYRLDGSQVFATAVKERCHDVVPHPSLPLALFVGRRPSTESYLVDTRDGRLLQTLHAPADRHFNGHAVFHQGGEWLYATENDTADPGRGVLGAYQLIDERLRRQNELSSHGLGPHQLLWMPDGETLVVANGGIRTEAESRVEMNLDAMEASLVLMGRDGTLHSKERLPEAMNSVRHLAVASDGTIVSGQQYMGDAMDAVPLLAIKRPGQPFQHFPVGDAQRQMMNQYTASVAVHSELRLLALTAPRGNRLFIWDLDSGALRLDAALPDCAGVGAVEQGFVVSAGIGRCRLYDCSGERIAMQPLELPAGLWDNHLRLA
ncbi:DUF1513 domain-containing protein [Phytopseudomonas dryadis]|uniref:DUF1513 domain-containing protein n=1 Tax=Phytopseudomonas dryadis TaxID=2487520 RepID=A0A4Q9R799_9GAMM|nr:MULTISPECIES: DUF1513 domain-containing protein [Pseudomonas]TBU96481.1 DUF1513 domain-containing protein [Pseudomonas dryadis]TBV03572.1 DUF1513 domain-containing protein [Pseudomonas dryadis]TBV16624.1 DUF1513 domain-containing protein [Pseudomonas sp. FRB 230]